MGLGEIIRCLKWVRMGNLTAMDMPIGWSGLRRLNGHPRISVENKRKPLGYLESLMEALSLARQVARFVR